MPTEIDPANTPRPLTLLDVLRDASPLPWLLTGEQHDDPEPHQATLPWHVPGNWPYAVIHQHQPGPIMGRGDGYQISRGTQNEPDARLIRAAREMAEAIAYALDQLDATQGTPHHMKVSRAARRLHDAAAAITGPQPTAKPCR